MATPFLRVNVFSDGSHSVTSAVPQPPPGDIFRVLTDYEIHRTDRFSFPMVFHFRESTCNITKEFQLYLCACNRGIYDRNPRHVATLLDDGRIVCNNGMGFGGGAEKQNWIIEEGLSPANPLPRWSKVFTCGDATIKMTDGIILMMDGSRLPELAIGVFHPLSREQALDPRSYKYIPQTHPERFFAAVTVNDDGKPRPFVNGSVYSWYKDGRTPVSFFPHVADLRDGLVNWPPFQAGENSAQLVRL